VRSNLVLKHLNKLIKMLRDSRNYLLAVVMSSTTMCGTKKINFWNCHQLLSSLSLHIIYQESSLLPTLLPHRINKC